MHVKPFIALLTLLSAACGVVQVGSLQNATPQHGEYHAPEHSVTSASVTLGAVAEDVTIGALAGGNYFDAKIDYLGTITYNASASNDTYNVTLTENANNLSYSGVPLKWDIGVDPAAPLSLTASTSSGSLALNLNDFTLTGLKATTSSGNITASLPATGKLYDAALSVSSGNVTVTAEDQAQINFSALKTSSGDVTLNTGGGSILSAQMETSSGVVTINGGSGAALNATVNVSSGAITLNLASGGEGRFTISDSSGAITAKVPQGAAVHLEVVQNSSGSVNLPSTMQRISGADKIGVWETSGFDQAEHQIFITVTNDSSGSIQIQ